MRISLFIKWNLLLWLFIATHSCSVSRQASTTVFDQELLEIIENYMSIYPEIKNECNALPYYELSFGREGIDTVLCVSGWLGLPGATYVDIGLKDYPKIIKRYYQLNNRSIVVYDFSESTGYGYYQPNLLSNKPKGFSSIPEFCGNTTYPEIWCYKITCDTIFLFEKYESPIIK